MVWRLLAARGQTRLHPVVVSENTLSPRFLDRSLTPQSTRRGYRFPIREYGLNYAAQPLQKHEIEAMTNDEVITRRIFTSYKMMVEFYGMRLEDETNGLISRSENYAARYRNLCSTSSPFSSSLDPTRSPGLVFRWAGVPCCTLYASLRGFEILSYPSVHFVCQLMNQSSSPPPLPVDQHIV